MEALGKHPSTGQSIRLQACCWCVVLFLACFSFDVSSSSPPCLSAYSFVCSPVCLSVCLPLAPASPKRVGYPAQVVAKTGAEDRDQVHTRGACAVRDQLLDRLWCHKCRSFMYPFPLHEVLDILCTRVQPPLLPWLLVASHTHVLATRQSSEVQREQSQRRRLMNPYPNDF